MADDTHSIRGGARAMDAAAFEDAQAAIGAGCGRQGHHLTPALTRRGA
jgi:hypothetical protein